MQKCIAPEDNNAKAHFIATLGPHTQPPDCGNHDITSTMAICVSVACGGNMDHIDRGGNNS
jgi:hypothetical protein